MLRDATDARPVTQNLPLSLWDKPGTHPPWQGGAFAFRAVCERLLLANVKFHPPTAAGKPSHSLLVESRISKVQKRWVTGFKRSEVLFISSLIKDLLYAQFSKNDKNKLSLGCCRNFSLLSGKSKGLWKEMRGPRLMSSFLSLHIPSSLSFRKVSYFLQSPQVHSELISPLLAAHRACFLQVVGCSPSQPAHIKEKLVAANMDKVIFLTFFFFFFSNPEVAASFRNTA